MIAKLTCPKCHKYWANLKYHFEKNGDLIPIKPTDVQTIGGGKRKRFKMGDKIACIHCGQPYSYYCISIAIAESLPTGETP